MFIPPRGSRRRRCSIPVAVFRSAGLIGKCCEKLRAACGTISGPGLAVPRTRLLETANTRATATTTATTITPNARAPSIASCAGDEQEMLPHSVCGSRKIERQVWRFCLAFGLRLGPCVLNEATPSGQYC